MIHDSDDKVEDSQGLRVGAYGWQHEHWLSEFYPEDLPKDWQLSYYANEYSTVLVPANYWQSEIWSPEQWQEDVPEHFMFFIECPKLDDYDDFLEEVSFLGNQLGGIIVDDQIVLETNYPVYCWHDENNKARSIWQINHHVNSDVACMQLNDTDLKTQKEYLAQFAKDSNGKPETVILLDENVPIKRLNEFKTLIELMGL